MPVMSLCGNCFERKISLYFHSGRMYEIEIGQDELDFFKSNNQDANLAKLKEIFDNHLVPNFEQPLSCFNHHWEDLQEAIVFKETEDEFYCQMIFYGVTKRRAA